MDKYSMFRSVWRLIPHSVQQSIYKRYGDRIEQVKHSLFSHEELYNASYYEHVEDAAVASAPGIATTIVETFDPADLLDVGCGTGAMMEAIRDLGPSVKGLEYSSAALELCKKRGLDVTRFDIENDSHPFPDRRFDVVISMEVAEHLPASVADRYVNVLCQSSDHVVFTAATPGQGGQDHINEQPREYWLEKFDAREFTVQDDLTETWRQKWRAGNVTHWYWKNLMVLKKMS